MSATTTGPAQRQFPCRQCGGSLAFAPGTESLKCPYCGTMNAVPHAAGGVEELDFRIALAALPPQEQLHERLVVKCGSCGAQSTLKQDVVSDKCPFCASPIVAEGSSIKQIKPRSVLPFRITRDQAAEAFRSWISGLWFAPSRLRRDAARGKIDGVYLPAWTYDADCSTSYTGERGDYYYTTETYTTTENGQTVTKTREVRHTRWSSASGRVANSFDDILIIATDALPREYLDKLAPWDLRDLHGFEEAYLSGFVAMSYDVDLHAGFNLARGIMDGKIDSTIRGDIGGDEQRISSKQTTFGKITFKHLLLPVWMSAYQFHGKTFRFFVNARSGRVDGERPYSWVKITALVLFIAGVIVAGVLWYSHYKCGATGSGC